MAKKFYKVRAYWNDGHESVLLPTFNNKRDAEKTARSWREIALVRKVEVFEQAAK